jgi:hypothetical protein
MIEMQARPIRGSLIRGSRAALVLAVSVFLWFSCGLPRNPFILDGSDVTISASPSYAIEVGSNNSIRFTLNVEIPVRGETHGVTIYYTYTDSSSETTGEDLDTSSSFLPQVIDQKNFYRFKLADSASSAPPTKELSFDSVLEYEAELQAVYAEEGTGEAVLTLTVNGLDSSLIRLDVNAGGEGIALSPDSRADFGIDAESEVYYLHLYAGVYAFDDDPGLDNAAAIAPVKYLGSVELE